LISKGLDGEKRVRGAALVAWHHLRPFNMVCIVFAAAVLYLFSRIKGRLCLENFTGKTVESVRQDFWSTVFISNSVTLATEGVEDQMNVESIDAQHSKKN
jgi:hypothetical protein